MTEQTEQEPIDPIAQCIRWLSFMVVNQEDRRMVQAELESIAAQVRERDAQIARLSEQVEQLQGEVDDCNSHAEYMARMESEGLWRNGQWTDAAVREWLK